MKHSLFLSGILLALVTHEVVNGTTSIFPAVVVGKSKGSCLSYEEQQKILQKIHTDVLLGLNNLLGLIPPQCGDGLWHRVGFLNMSDTTQQCPQAWREYNSSGVRACGRPDNLIGSCPSTTYPTGGQYSRVCGRIIGYQVGSPSAFVPSRDLNLINILDGIYVDGVSVTYGSPRSHIWTYAAGSTEGLSGSARENCPCHYNPDNTEVVRTPDSIQNSTYCESGNAASNYNLGFLYSTDPLWDGQQCERQCCSNGKSPPWFSVQLPDPTSDDIEVRICGNQDTHDEDNPISLLELYIQ